MNIVYDSTHYAILAYPAQEGFEVVDKEGGRALFIQGEMAFRFRQAIDEIPAEQRDEEAIDEFLDGYCIGARPFSFH